jgi:hypothetical protein
MTVNPQQIASLVEAFHTVYDIKDNAGDAGRRDGLFYACYETTNHLSDLIVRLGGTAPSRFDGTGREDNPK